MVKDDSLYIIAIVAVVAVVGLVVMATSSSSVVVAEDLPSMVEDSDSTAIAGQAISASSGGGVSSTRDATVTAISELEEETKGMTGEHCRPGVLDPCESLCADQTYGYNTESDYGPDGDPIPTPEEQKALQKVYDDCVETCNEEGWMDDVYCINI